MFTIFISLPSNVHALHSLVDKTSVFVVLNVDMLLQSMSIWSLRLIAYESMKFVNEDDESVWVKKTTRVFIHAFEKWSLQCAEWDDETL